jgi:hypothetical protein
MIEVKKRENIFGAGNRNSPGMLQRMSQNIGLPTMTFSRSLLRTLFNLYRKIKLK